MENIKLALDHGIEISMRVNVNKTNISGIRTLIDELKPRGLTEYKNFSYYFKSAFEYFRVTEENFVSDSDVVSFLYDFSMSRWRTRTVDRMTPCKTCPIQMLCGGGCAAANIDDLTKAECKETKEIFTELAPRILWKVRHERFESLRDFDDGGVKEADKTDSGDISNEVQVHSKYKDNHPDCMSLSMREFLSGFTAEERNIMMTTDNERELFDILKAHK